MTDSKKVALKILHKSLLRARKANDFLAKFVEDDDWFYEDRKDKLERRWGTFNVRREPANDD